MKDNVMEYRGYHTVVRYVPESNSLRGVIEGINDYVDFECKDLKSVEKEFHNAVDDYLAMCKELGKEPEKEFKGTFNVRIKPELHKQLYVEALREGESLNKMVEKSISYFISQKQHA